MILAVCPLSAMAEAPISFQTAQEKEAEEKALEKEARALNKEVSALKKDILQLNQSLYRFEEQLLHPVETQFAVFLAVAPNTRFNLDSIALRLGDTLISSHLYEEKEIKALRQGSVQRLYVGSLSDGKYKLTASINGQGASSKYHRTNKPIKFAKNEKAKYIQLVVGEDRRTGKPLIKVKQW